MRVNLISLTIQSNNRFVSLHPVNEYMINQAEKTKDLERWKQYSCHPRWLCLPHAETLAAIDCLRGKAAFYPYFDDGIHLIKFSPSGFVEVYLQGGQSERFYFTLPGPFVADLLQDALDNAPTEQNDRYTLEVSPQDLLDLACDYAPVCRWEYAPIGFEPPDYKPTGSTLDYITKDLADPRQTGLDRQLDGLRRIALNYSDGIPSRISISLDYKHDDRPSGYFWRIKATDRLTGKEFEVMHGGIIPHKNTEAETWEYSTHT